MSAWSFLQQYWPSPIIIWLPLGLFGDMTSVYDDPFHTELYVPGRRGKLVWRPWDLMMLDKQCKCGVHERGTSVCCDKDTHPAEVYWNGAQVVPRMIVLLCCSRVEVAAY